LGYGLRFVRSMLVAKFLGPHFLGVWGFLILIQQYLSYTSLGLQLAVNVELATESVDKSREQSVIQTAFTTTLVISSLLIVLGVGVWWLGIPLFEKYSFEQYAIAMGLITGFTHLQQLFKSVYRAYGNFFRIAAGELLDAAIILLAALAFRDDKLISALLGAMVLSGIIGNAILIIKAPFKISFSLDIECLKGLLSIGIPLLIYTVSFYLIAVSARTIISIFYPVEILGYYSFANSITSVTILGFQAVTWAIFPRVLFKSREGLPNDVVAGTVQKVNDLYNSAVFLTALGIILMLPLLFLFLPQYEPAEGVINILLLSQIVISISFGYNSVAVARKRQSEVAKASLAALIVMVGLGSLVAFSGLPFIWIAISLLASTFVYTFLQVQIGSRILGQTESIRNMLPPGSLIAIMISLVGGLSGKVTIGAFIGLIVFAVMSRSKIVSLGNFILQGAKV
jgi:O-antigen/teichoic acid export membrane protein